LETDTRRVAENAGVRAQQACRGRASFVPAHFLTSSPETFFSFGKKTNRRSISLSLCPTTKFRSLRFGWSSLGLSPNRAFHLID